MIKGFKYIKSTVYISLFYLAVTLSPSLLIAGTIEVTDKEGNFYTLFEDGTYKKMEKKRLSDNEIAEKVVSAIATYKKVFGKEIPQEQRDCMHKMVVENTGDKWQKLYFIMGPWDALVEWVTELPVENGLVPNHMLVVQGQGHLLGAMHVAGERCGLNND